MGLFYDPCYEGIKRGIRGKDIMVIMTMAIIKMMMIWTRLGRWWFGAWVSALLRKGKKGNPANICSTFFLQLITRPFPSSSSLVLICWWTLFYSHISLFQHRTWFYWRRKKLILYNTNVSNCGVIHLKVVREHLFVWSVTTGHTHSLSLWLREKRSTAAKEQSIFTSFSKSHSSRIPRRPSCPKSEKSERRDWFQAGFAPMRH